MSKDKAENKEKTVLLAQIVALDRNLDRMLSLLLSDRLKRYGLHPKFLRVISPSRLRLTPLKSNVKEQDLNRAQLEWSWGEYLALKKELQPAFNQCLDVIGGIAVRQWEMDEGMCDLSEHLISNHLMQGATWASVTIVGADSLFDDVTKLTQIIRLRFPEWDIWSLPLIGYEFGRLLILREDYIAGQQKFFKEEQEHIHRLITVDEAAALVAARDILAEEFADGQITGLAAEFGKLRQEYKDGKGFAEIGAFVDQQGIYLRELFADAFATYFLGPAYVFARVCLRMDPTEALTNSTQEPSMERRLELMLRLLEMMGEAAVERDRAADGPYEPVSRRIKAIWVAAIEPLSTGYQFKPATTKPYDRWVTSLFNKLVETYSDSGFSIADWKSAEKLAETLEEAAPEDLTGITLPVILNAVWLSRFRREARIKAIEDNASAAMRRVSDTQGEQGPDVSKPGLRSQTVSGRSR